ncbi:MAG: glycosyltransferase family 2 protein [Burkholderiales bacterium]|nr:glycosyltransferase family 2 protein [Burkholderiales bacterium]
MVLYHPRALELEALIGSLQQASSAIPLQLVLWRNDSDAVETPGLKGSVARVRAGGLSVRFDGGKGNLGFGPAVNAALAEIKERFLLLLNQDAIPEPGALERLLAIARADDLQIAAWEMRQIPYEHPKDYDPVTGETGWVSGAAVLLRTRALREVGGFEPRFFMYCEDVDLSWRLRCAGWRLRYLPQCAVVHRTYDYAGQIKPLAALQGAYANLCLRQRFGTRADVTTGVRALLRELQGPQPFPGRRRGLVRALLKFARNRRYFARTRAAAPDFVPRFNGWDYEERREGSFHPFLAQAERLEPLPAISAIVRATGDAVALAATLHCLEQQTHPLLEVLVVGGTDRAMQAVCARAGGRLALRPLPATDAALETIAAVHAQADWWLLFDDESVRAFADHAEVLLQAALDQGAPAASALVWLIEADPADHAAAHRLHAPRTTLGGEAAARTTWLQHRHAPAQARRVEVAKTTGVRYVGRGSASAS